MKRKSKVILLSVLVIAIAGAIFASVKAGQKGVVTVQTGKVNRSDLAAVVTASGEVKPRNYINIGTNAQGPAPITAIYVKEGQHVRKGQVLARLAAIQPSADLVAQKASLNAMLADSAATEAGLKSSDDAITVAEAIVEHDKADLDQRKADFARSQSLFEAKLISKQDFDATTAAYNASVATLTQSRTRVQQARSARAQAAAQLTSAQRKITQGQAMVSRSGDILAQYNAVAPLDGVITNLPVRVGETVVPGIQNSASSTIMTIADMSIITAEVKVDETDIVSVKLDQPADVTIDAIPDRTFKGHVIEIGDTAIIRSSGVAASQSQTSSQEAKDFKVVVALDIPEDLVRPGLSCTAKVTTATRNMALSIPIQALTMRQQGQLKPPPPKGQAPEQPTPAQMKADKQEIQGVFLIQNGKAVFHKIATGIAGATEIEVLNGLRSGDEVVTGSYQVIRTIRNDARVKVDNKIISPQPNQAQG